MPSGRARAAEQAKWAARWGGVDVGELGEEQVQVGLVVAVAAGPAGREDAGGAVEDVHAEAGVVGDGGQAGGPGEGVGLEEGVLGEGDAGFLDVGDLGERVRADELVVESGVGEDRVEFGDLARVAGGEDQTGHVPIIGGRPGRTVRPLVGGPG
ncbi:hypothetical protein GCM10019017_50840 [Streptomyces showdoensis]